MTWVLVAAAVLVAWCALALPLAVAVGRAFRAGDDQVADLTVSRRGARAYPSGYDAAGV